MTILQDPTRPLDPPPAQEFLEPGRDAEGTHEPLNHQPLPRRSRPRATEAPSEGVRAALRARGLKGKTSFELASRGGYVRTVTGTIAYLDEEAQTYMVLVDGELVRVPLRDITSTRDTSMSDGDGSGSERDTEGLGTGQ
jgi:hypothetical protein